MAIAITLTAATAEQQALELCTKLAKLIADDTLANPTANRKALAVSQNINLATQRATFSIVLPLIQTNSADGGIEFDADPVLA